MSASSGSFVRGAPIALASTLLAAAAVPVGAQEAGKASEQVSEVVVTANRAGAQRLQDIPMAVSALATDDLASKGLAAMQDFLRSVPGVSLDAAQPGLNRILMRGLVSAGLDYTQIQDRSLVAVYLDDIPITLNTANPDLRVADLERVEVIRGPQGTLYGAGSMAGTVRYITRKPDPQQFSGMAEAQSSATTRGGVNWNLKGSVNLPLIADHLALRLGAYQEDEDGYVDNIGTAQKDANTLKNTQASAALRWLPSSALTLDLTAIYQNLDRNGTSGVYRELGNRYSSSTPVGFKDDLKIFNLAVSYDAGAVQLISSTSYVDRQFQLDNSFDFFNEGIFGVRFVSPSVQVNNIENFTQELRMVSDKGRLRWQAGAFYGHDKRGYQQDTFALGLDQAFGIDSQALFAPNPDELYYGNIQVTDKQWALFGEATVELSEKLALTAGLRYFDFTGPAKFFQGGLAGTDAVGLPVTNQATEKSNGVNPKLLLSYKPADDLLLFVEAAKGFRYGGVNYPVPPSLCGDALAADGLTSAPLTFGPDKVWSYSLGEKWTAANHRLLLNATAFLVKWRDAQTIHPLSCGYPFIENGGKVKSQGVELESVFKMTDALDVNLNFTYTDAQSDGGIETIDARDGDKVPFFPKWSAAVAADYTQPFAAGEMVFSAGYSYRGKMGTEFNPTVAEYRRIPPSAVLNASVNYRTGPWEVGIFGTNLTDSKQISEIAIATSPTEPGDQVYLGRPRTVGLRLQRKF